VNNNVRSGAGWGAGGGWNDGTAGSFPDWVQITFNGQKTIDHVVVFTLQDNYATPVEPSNTMTFSKYGITAFQVQGWNGTAWITLGSVSGNNLVKRTVSFASFATDRIRIQVTGALASYSRITEIEAWTAASAATSSTNFALASNGGTAVASSTNGPGFMPATLIDNHRASGAVASFLCVKPGYSFHLVQTDKGDFVDSVVDTMHSDLRINGGYFVFQPEIFDYIEAGEDLVDEPFARLSEARLLYANKYDGFWAPMDTLKDQQNLEALYDRGYPPWAVWREPVTR